MDPGPRARAVLSVVARASCCAILILGIYTVRECMPLRFECTFVITDSERPNIADTRRVI